MTLIPFPTVMLSRAPNSNSPKCLLYHVTYLCATYVMCCPTDADASKAEHYIARASNSLKLRRFQSAADDAEAAIALAPQNATAHFRKGYVDY